MSLESSFFFSFPSPLLLVSGHFFCSWDLDWPTLHSVDEPVGGRALRCGSRRSEISRCESRKGRMRWVSVRSGCSDQAIEMWSFCWDAEPLMAVPHTVCLSLQPSLEIELWVQVWTDSSGVRAVFVWFSMTALLLPLNDEIWLLNRRCWLILFCLFLWKFVWRLLIRFFFVFRRRMPWKVCDIFPQILWRLLFVCLKYKNLFIPQP